MFPDGQTFYHASESRPDALGGRMLQQASNISRVQSVAHFVCVCVCECLCWAAGALINGFKHIIPCSVDQPMDAIL